MTTPDNTEHPNEEAQGLTDENLGEVTGGIRPVGTTGALEGATLTNGHGTGGSTGGNGGNGGLLK